MKVEGRGREGEGRSSQKKNEKQECIREKRDTKYIYDDIKGRQYGGAESSIERDAQDEEGDYKYICTVTELQKKDKDRIQVENANMKNISSKRGGRDKNSMAYYYIRRGALEGHIAEEWLSREEKKNKRSKRHIYRNAFAATKWRVCRSTKKNI